MIKHILVTPQEIVDWIGYDKAMLFIATAEVVEIEIIDVEFVEIVDR